MLEVGDAVVAGGFTFLGIVVTKTTDLLISRHKDASGTVKEERASLSKDEQDFRKTILTQLKDCHDKHEAAREQNVECEKRAIELERRLTIVDRRVAQLETPHQRREDDKS